MYLITIKNPLINQQKELSLPLTERQLEHRLKENGITSINDLIELSNFINDGTDFPQLPNNIINNVDIFEINFLAQRIESLSIEDQEDMSTIMKSYDVSGISDLVNLTYEIENGTYSVIEEVDNHLALGKWFVKENYPHIPSVILENINIDDVGYEVDQFVLCGKFFDGGYVYEDSPLMQESYDGIILPDFDYLDDHIAKIQVTNISNTRSTYLKLPASIYAYQRLCQKLDCTGIHDSNIKIDPSVNMLGTTMRLEDTFNLAELNQICAQIEAMDDKELKKLTAVLEYISLVDEERIYYKFGLTDCTLSNQLMTLVHHLNDFDYFEGVHSPRDYAYYLTTESNTFDIAEELIPYVNFDQLGEDWTNQEGGIFVSSGYVIDETPDRILEQSEELEL